MIDNDQTRRLIEHNSQSKLYDIEVANNGQEIIDILLKDAKQSSIIFNKKRIEVVVIDANMPIWDGFEVLKQIRNNPLINDVKVIMIGSSSEAQDLVDALFAGASDYIVAPVKIKELIARIENQIKRKIEDDQRREIEARYQAIMSMAEGVIVQDIRSDVITFNPSASKILGINSSQLVSNRIIPDNWYFIKEDGSLLPDDEHPSIITLKTGNEISDYILGLKRGENEDITWLSVNTRPLFHESSSTPYAVVTSISDVTKRKKAEDGLKESEEKFRALTTFSPIAIFIIRNDQFIYVNPAFESITGYKLSQLADITIWNLIHPDDHARARQRIISKYQGDNSYSHGEYRIITASGEVKWIDISLTSIYYQGKHAFMGSGTDITETKRVENILWENKLIGELGTFTSTVTTEIADLLDNILKTALLVKNGLLKVWSKISSTSFYLNEKERIESENKENISQMISNIDDTMGILTSQIMQALELVKSYQSLSSKYQPDEKRLFNLRDLVNQTLISIKPILKEKHHQILFSCPENLYIHSYPDALMHIMINLIKNSLTHAFYPEQSGIIRMDFQASDRQLIFTYSDNGKGLNADAVNQFFSFPFLQQFKMMNKGIGIFIIYRLVSKVLKGSIKCESEENKGTRFIIKIPL